MKSTYDAAGGSPRFSACGTGLPSARSTSPSLRPLRRARGDSASRKPRTPRPRTPSMRKYLASLNLSSKSKLDYDFKILPRPRGKDTKVVITEYDLPRSGRPAARRGFGCRRNRLVHGLCRRNSGRLDPRTGEIQGMFRTRRPRPAIPVDSMTSSSILLEISGWGATNLTVWPCSTKRPKNFRIGACRKESPARAFELIFWRPRAPEKSGSRTIPTTKPSCSIRAMEVLKATTSFPPGLEFFGARQLAPQYLWDECRTRWAMSTARISMAARSWRSRPRPEK